MRNVRLCPCDVEKVDIISCANAARPYERGGGCEEEIRAVINCGLWPGRSLQLSRRDGMALCVIDAGMANIRIAAGFD